MIFMSSSIPSVENTVSKEALGRVWSLSKRGLPKAEVLAGGMVYALLDFVGRGGLEVDRSIAGSGVLSRAKSGDIQAWCEKYVSEGNWGALIL